MKTLLISDFSKTLTLPTSKTTWSLFKESGLFPEEYQEKRDELFEEYRPFEIEGNNEKVREWFSKHLELLGSYDAISKMPDVIEISKKSWFLLPREGLEVFRIWCWKNDIEIRIVSSGIKQLIDEFLIKNSFWPKTNTDYSVIANSISLIKNGENTVATPTDKFHHVSFDFKKFERVIVLGDAPEDFNIPGVTYVTDWKFHWYSFSDLEIVPWVTPLGKDASLSSLIAYLNLINER